jgi:hypothetical protein
MDQRSRFGISDGAVPEPQGFKLDRLALDEEHCRVLGGYSRPGLEIELIRCKLTSAGTSVLVEVLGRNQGPTKLICCDIDNLVLADGLRGNSRLKCLTPNVSNDLEVRNREVLAIADALKENKGLAVLNLYDYSISDESWDTICDSLKTHSTLQVLNLFSGACFEAPAVRKSQVQALLDMVKMNLSLHTINVHKSLSRHELFRGSVIPYLQTNRLRPRLLAIQKTRPITFRAKVLGRALLAIRTDPNRFWMLLSGNAEVAFPPKNATIAAAANLPTPATAAATSTTTNVAGVAASVMAALPTTVTGSLPAAAAAAATSATTPSNASASDPTVAAAAAAAANVATPSAGQKRKARP